MHAKNDKMHIRLFIYLIIATICSYRLFLIWSYSFGIPATDFFDFRQMAILMEQGKIPWGYKRLPLFPLFMIFFAQPFKLLGIRDPYLFSAYFINMTTMSASIPLLYLINKKILKNTVLALLSTFLFFINPEYLQWNIQPILETFFVFSILITFYFYFTSSRLELKYVGVCLTSLIRYEAILLAPIFVMDDILFEKQAKKSFLIGSIAVVPSILWIISAYIIYDIPAYLKEIQSMESHVGWSFLKTICDTITSGVYYYGAYYGTGYRFLVIVFAVFLLLIIGLFFYHKNRYFAPLFLWFCGYTVLHMYFTSDLTRYVIPILWLIMSFCVFGINVIFRSLMKTGHFNFSTPQQLILMPLIIVFFSFYQFYNKNYVLRTLIIDFIISLSLMSIFSAVILLEVGKRKNIHKIIFVLAILLIVNLGAVFNGDIRTQRIANEKIQFKEVGEWFKQTSTESDIIVATDAHLIQYYAELPEKHFIRTGQLLSNNTEELIEELTALNVTYIMWDSHHGRRQQDYIYYENKVFLITFLEDGVDKHNFKLMYSVNIENKIAYVYKFVP